MKVTELIESAGIYLARRDLEYGKKLGIDVFVQGDKETKEVYMTAGCMIPFSEENFLDQIDNAAEFQSYATSTATALKLQFTASTTAPTNGSGVIPVISYGACPNL